MSASDPGGAPSAAREQRTVPVPARGASAPPARRGGRRRIAALHGEIDRSRRHGHACALVRVTPIAPAGRRAARRRGALLAGKVRGIDSVWVDGRSAFVLLPETARDEAAVFVERIGGLGVDDDVALAVFPDDGLTAAALVAALDRLPEPPGVRGVAPAPPEEVVARPRAGKAYRAAKRAFDLAVAALTLPLVLPVLLLCALAVKLDSPGPAIYAQERTGRHGRRFRMYKLRTMVADADEMKESLRHLSVLPPPDFKILDDPRVTRVGRFLRATSLDELPQLVNVLKGDMSLVGPRPTFVRPEQFHLWHTARLDVRPGITGLWQIEARHASDFDERQRLDIAYVNAMSFWLDLKIVARTFGAVFRSPGA